MSAFQIRSYIMEIDKQITVGCEIKARNLEMCLWHKQSNKTMYGIPRPCQMYENILRAKIRQ
jgi:hypothetical protein